MRFNPPPNWPAPPAGWTPPPGWLPDPSWGPPPEGWLIWTNDDGSPIATGSPSPGWTAAPTKKKHTGRNILIGLGAVVALFIVIGAIGGGGGDEVSADTAAADIGEPPASDAATEGTAEEEPPPAEEPAAAPALPGIGTPVRDGKFEFVVTGVERPGSVIGEGFLEETAQGEFVIIRVNVTNIGDEPQTLSSYGQVLYNDQGQKFEPSSAIFALEDADKFFLENINPGNTVTGAPLLFDVAPGTVLDRIELHDSAFSGGVDVSLR